MIARNNYNQSCGSSMLSLTTCLGNAQLNIKRGVGWQPIPSCLVVDPMGAIAKQKHPNVSTSLVALVECLLATQSTSQWLIPQLPKYVWLVALRVCTLCKFFCCQNQRRCQKKPYQRMLLAKCTAAMIQPTLFCNSRNISRGEFQRDFCNGPFSGSKAGKILNRKGGHPMRGLTDIPFGPGGFGFATYSPYANGLHNLWRLGIPIVGRNQMGHITLTIKGSPKRRGNKKAT